MHRRYWYATAQEEKVQYVKEIEAYIVKAEEDNSWSLQSEQNRRSKRLAYKSWICFEDECALHSSVILEAFVEKKPSETQQHLFPVIDILSVTNA